MNVATILSAKGNTVEVVHPDTPVTVAVHRMATRGIGSLVVVGPDDQMIGVVGERDIVRGMDHHGERFRELRVRDVVNTSVATCTVNEDIAEVMRRMTATRSRHMPVLEGSQVVGLISIGDVVKQRLGELELETHVLRDVYLEPQLTPSPSIWAQIRLGFRDESRPETDRAQMWGQCPGVNVTGRWSGPKMPTASGFHVISPSRARSGIRRASSGSASCSSARARAAPRQ